MKEEKRSCADQALIEKLIYLLEDQLEQLDLIASDISNRLRSGQDAFEILDDARSNTGVVHDKLAIQLNKLD